MAGTLGARSRRLMLSRDSSPASTRPRGVVWTSSAETVDVDKLADGELVVADYVIDGQLDDVVSMARRFERVTRDPEERGVIRDPLGRELGVVRVTKRGGVILEFSADGRLAADGRAESSPPAPV